MLRNIVIGFIFTSALLQVIPFGHDHTNPAVIQEPAWDSPHTRGLVKRACFNCHSNETIWPWYSHIAPISWLTQRDVNTGRSYLNFSEWNDPMNPVDVVVVEVQAGNMPPWFYLPMHPEARLSDAERKELIRGLQKSLMCSKP